MKKYVYHILSSIVQNTNDYVVASTPLEAIKKYVKWWNKKGMKVEDITIVENIGDCLE